MRDQAVGTRRKVRKRRVKPASMAGFRKSSMASLRWLLRVIPVTIYIAVLILSAWLLYYSLTSPYFAVRDAMVTGTSLLDGQQVREASSSLGQNVLLIQTAEVQRSVREFTAVRGVRGVTALPGRLEIEVVERTPLAQWQTKEGTFLVDREGVVLDTGAPSNSLFVVRDLEGPSLKLGGRANPVVLAAAESLARLLPEQAGFRPSQFDYSEKRGLSVEVEGGPAILFGDASDLDEKLAALSAIRAHLEATKARAETIDLRFKGRPVYVLASPVPAKSGPSRP